MPSSAVDSLPATISAGDSLAWSLTVPEFPASAGWTLHLGAACTSPAAALNFAAATAPDGVGYAFNVSPGTTAAWKAGRYLCAFYVTRSTPTEERHTFARGSFRVLADPMAAAVALGHAQRALSLIEAAIEGRIPRGLEETNIDGQTISRTPLMTLYILKEKYRAEVANLERAAAAAVGIRRPTTISVRFTG